MGPMDPNPNAFPILSYVMSKIPSMSPKRGTDSFEFDIEQPPPPQRSDPSTSKGPYFELTERMPHLSDPKVIASMRSAVSDVARTRSILQNLGERPDHESVDAAKAKIAEIDSALTKQLEDILLAPGPADVERMQWRLIQAKKEEECRKAADKQKQLFKAVISLDDMHESYGKLLKEAEQKLEKIYEAAAAGRDPEESSTENPAPAAEEGSEEVVAILQDAYSRKVEMIDLSGRRLRHLPEVFGRISSLVVLNLSSNQLEVIPDSIAGLEHLHALNLSSNHLESLPDSIGFLVNLKTLDVSSNKLTTLPDSISYCRSLLELDASFNRLTYLPTNIGYQLVHLQRLSAQLNKIRSLPTSIGEMHSLCLLDLHFNELRGLPSSIGRLTNLEILNLSSNFSDLTELPDTISDLANLKELDLSNNQIRELPLTFGRLSNLTKLNLDQNPIVAPPKEIVAQGVEAVKVFMTKRWVDVILDEERKSEIEVQEQQLQTSWLTRSASWLNNFVMGISASGSGQVEAMGKGREDPYLNKPL